VAQNLYFRVLRHFNFASDIAEIIIIIIIIIIIVENVRSDT